MGSIDLFLSKSSHLRIGVVMHVKSPPPLAARLHRIGREFRGQEHDATLMEDEWDACHIGLVKGQSTDCDYYFVHACPR